MSAWVMTLAHLWHAPEGAFVAWACCGWMPERGCGAARQRPAILSCPLGLWFLLPRTDGFSVWRI